YRATLEEDNTFTAAVKCPSATLQRHCLMLVLPVVPSFRKSPPPWLKDGEVGNKGIARLISHQKRLHLSTDERKCVLRETIFTDHGLYMAVEETLKVFDQWLCGKCMTLHAVSRVCHHPDGLVRISKPFNTESKTKVIEGLVLDAELLDCVFKVPITTVKCIPYGCRFAFSQVLKTVLYKVVSQPDFVDAYVRVVDGHFTAAVKVLSSSSVAPYCDDTFKALEAKHLYKPPTSMSSNTFSEPLLIAEIDSVFGCIKSFPKEFVAYVPLTPLLKPDNGIWPIAVGNIWRRLVSKVSMKGVDGLGQHMSLVEYRTILKYRLMILLFSVDVICPVCRKACLDSFGKHVVHCKELPGFKYRHDMIMDVLYDICRRVGISVKKEAPVNFLTDLSDGRSTLRLADVLVFGWVEGKHACVDQTMVSPLVGLSSRGFIVGQAALKAASCKVTKHDKACIKNQQVFIRFAFDTFGFLAP
nr:putative exostosin-like protein [Tanacetum cinerariifolium]